MKKLLFILTVSLIGLGIQPRLFAATDNFNVTLTIDTLAALTMADIAVGTIDPSGYVPGDAYVSTNTGALSAESNAPAGYTVVVTAQTASTIVTNTGWNMVDTAGAGNTITFSLLADQDKTGTSTPITKSGKFQPVGGGPGGTTLTDSKTVIDHTGGTLQRYLIYAYIHAGQIDVGQQGNYTWGGTMTLTAK